MIRKQGDGESPGDVPYLTGKTSLLTNSNSYMSREKLYVGYARPLGVRDGRIPTRK